MCRKRARSPIYYLPQVHGEPCIGRGIRGSEKELRGEVEELPGGVETGRSSEARKKVRLERESVCGRVEDGVTERVNVATREHIEAAKREQVGVRDVHRAMEYERGVSLHGSPALRVDKMGQKENSNTTRPPLRVRPKLYNPPKITLRSVNTKTLAFGSENARATGKAEVKHKFLRATAPPGWVEELAGEKVFSSGSLPRVLRERTGKGREQQEDKANIVGDKEENGKDYFQPIRSNKGKERESEVSLESKIRSAIAKHNESRTVKSVKWDPSIVRCGPVTDLVRAGEEYDVIPVSEKEAEKESAKEDKLYQKEHAVPASEKLQTENEPGVPVPKKALKKKRLDVRAYMPWTEKESYIRDTAALRTRARQLVSPTVVEEDSIEECFKTISQWTKGNQKKLQMLMEALKADDNRDDVPWDHCSPACLPGTRNNAPESDPNTPFQTTPILKARKYPFRQDMTALDIGRAALEKLQAPSLPTGEGKSATTKGTLDPEAPLFQDSSTLKVRRSRILDKKSVIDVESPTLPPKQRALQEKRCSIQIHIPHRDFTTMHGSKIRKAINSHSLPNVSVTRTCPQLPLENFDEPLWIPSSVVTALPRMPFGNLVTISQLSNSTHDENEQGRTALAMDDRLARPLLARFMSKYPLTGTKKAPLKPRLMPTVARGKYAADLQQQLEFILLQKKEKQALDRIFGKAH
ncbi:hypothetical protein B7494_g6972 [Chlorociboria aeruginascens]|nr:hypothetical protein B7494_g6972 [Chlorociboria aeruginascens]